MNMQEAAQEMVDAIATLMRARTINIMDNHGIIIASSDLNRIGTFHRGAAEVISSGKVVRIFKHELLRYEGAKEGINMPIVINNEMIGVVGIYGDPDSLEEMANLLSVYVKQYFTQSALIKQEQLKTEIRTQLLKLILFRQDFTDDKAYQISSIINLKIKFPIRTLVISLGNATTDKMAKFKALDKIAGILATNGYINPNHDIYGLIDECFVLLKSTDAILLEGLYEIIKSGQGLMPSIAMGEKSESLIHIPYAYDSALTLALANDQGCFRMDENRMKLNYLMHSIAKMDQVRFIEKMYNPLLEYFKEDGIEETIKTVEVYCETSGSINQAADLLHIHKNTMLYRIKKIYSIMEIEEEDKFTKECFLRILLIHHQSIRI